MRLNSSNRDKLIILALIAFFSLGYRLLYAYRFDTSALLYVGFPAAISLVLILFTRRSTNEKWTTRYLNHTRSALIVMLGSSILLFEGFLCVLMFMPIYFGIMAIVFVCRASFLYSPCLTTLKHAPCSGGGTSKPLPVSTLVYCQHP